MHQFVVPFPPKNKRAVVINLSNHPIPSMFFDMLKEKGYTSLVIGSPEIREGLTFDFFDRLDEQIHEYMRSVKEIKSKLGQPILTVEGSFFLFLPAHATVACPLLLAFSAMLSSYFYLCIVAKNPETQSFEVAQIIDARHYFSYWKGPGRREYIVEPKEREQEKYQLWKATQSQLEMESNS